MAQQLPRLLSLDTLKPLGAKVALIGNYSIINRMPIRQFNTGASSGYQACYTPPSALKNRFYGGISKLAATPNGYLAPGAWVLPMTGGGMASYVLTNCAISVASADLKAGKALEGSATLAIAVSNADLARIIQMIASAVLQIAVSNGALSAAVSASGSASLVMAKTDAILGGLFSVTASGALTLTPAATLTALAFMVAEAGGAAPLSAEGLAESVWNSVAASFNTAGTMGEKLNDAGSAANPWTEVIEGTYTATEVLRLLLAVAAGKTTIVDNGGGSATVTFRDTDDSTDRVIADMQDSERQTMTLDPA